MAECVSVTMFLLAGSLGTYMMLLGAYAVSVQGVCYLGIMLLVGFMFMVILCLAVHVCHGGRLLVSLSDIGYAGPVVVFCVLCVCCGWLGLACFCYGMAKSVLAVDCSMNASVFCFFFLLAW